MAIRVLTGGAAAFEPLTATYLVETPVGNGADNKRIADVQLVQLFLREFYDKQPALFKKRPQPAGRSEQGISLDGKVGI